MATSTQNLLAPIPGDSNIYVFDKSDEKYYTKAEDGKFTVEVTDETIIERLITLNPRASTSSISNDSISSDGSGLTTADFITDPNTLKGNNIPFENYIYPKEAPAGMDMVEFTPAELNLNSGITPNFNGQIPLNTTDPLRTSPNARNARRRQFVAISNGGSVKLGIQGTIADTNMVGWGDNTVGPFEAIMYNAAITGLNGELNFAKGIEAAIESLTDQAGGLANQMFKNGSYRALFASMAAGNPGLFTRATSLAINPNLELLFQAPQLRPFDFTFMLSGSTDKESSTIKSIIKFFKYHMAPKVSNGPGIFLKSPNVFFIRYIDGKNNDEHNSIGRITSNNGQKACALTNFNVDYTPMGSYMTYAADTSMVVYRIQLRFSEIVPVYDVDYEGLPENAIGY